MKTIVFAWELGGGLGHISHFLPLADRLLADGHRVVFVLRDLRLTSAALGHRRIEILQAPLWLGGTQRVLQPVNYAEMLMNFGYLEPEGLHGIVCAWRHLFHVLQPDLLIVSHSPTALLAARGTGLPTMMVDTGFGSPPRLDPLPPMRWWLTIPQERLVRTETAVRNAINRLLERDRLPPLSSLAELLSVDVDVLCTFSELDHYPMRPPNADYWGPMFRLDADQSPRWPDVSGRRVFVYVRRDFRGQAAFWEAIRSADASVLVYAQGCNAETLMMSAVPHVRVETAPVNIDAVRREADLVICHGPGLSAAVLLSGCPIMLIPTQLEQYLCGKRIDKLGAGLSCPAGGAADLFSESMRRLIDEARFRETAKGFAARYAWFDQRTQLERMMSACKALVFD